MAASLAFNDDALTIKGVPITAVTDIKDRLWYKGHDVAAALGYTNASYLINKYVLPRDKLPFRDIQMYSQDHVPIGVDNRNVFINISGLKSILSSCGSIDVQVKKENPELKYGKELRVMAKEEPKSYSKHEPNQFGVSVSSGQLQINDCPILHVVDYDGVKWFKANDIAEAFNITNTSYALSKNVEAGDRMPLKQINATSSPADPRCIFINSRGLKSFLSAYQGTVSNSHLNALKNGTTSRTYDETKVVYPKKIDPLARDSSAEMTASPPKYIIIKGAGSPREYEVLEVSLVKLKSLADVKWKRETRYRKLFETVASLLSPWYDSETKLYHNSLTKLVDLVSQICDGFHQTKMFVEGHLKRPVASAGSIPQQLSDGEVKELANKIDNSDRLGWIYIASNDKYAKKNIFKVGSTTRLIKRLNGYKTGRMEEDFLHYFWVRRVFDCGKIDNLILHFLDERAQKIEKNFKVTTTEMYTIDFQSLKKIVIEVINFYESCYDSVCS